MDKELKILFDEDQQDCLNQPSDSTPEHEALRKRIQDRLTKVQVILNTNKQFSGEDYFHACILFMHSDCTEDFWQAYQLGLKSIKLKHDVARKYTAAAYDRWLMYQGKPQKYGLQYVPDGTRLRIWDVDPETTDEERAEWNVPPLQELYKVAEEATKNYDMSKIDMNSKPQWLKEAVKKWSTE